MPSAEVWIAAASFCDRMAASIKLEHVMTISKVISTMTPKSMPLATASASAVGEDLDLEFTSVGTDGGEVQGPMTYRRDRSISLISTPALSCRAIPA